MAIALVKAGAVQTGTTTCTPAFGQATGSGNLLVCLVASGSTSSPTISGSWVTATSFPSNMAIFYLQNSAGGDAAPTVTGSSGSTIYAVLFEFSGAATTGALDQTQSSAVGTTPQTATMSGADVTAGELLVSADLISLTKAGTDTTSDSYNNGATPTTNLNNDGTSVALHYRFAWGTTTGNASADSNTLSDTSMNLSGLGTAIASFKVASAAATTPDIAMGLTVT